MDIKWQRGKFIKFFAKMKIRVGGANAVDIQKGDEFEYDGSILKYGGAEIPSPQARGAIKEGWATTTDDGESDIAPVSPTRNVAKATSVNRDLSRVARGPSQQLQTDSQDEDTVLDVSDRRPDAKANPRAQPRVMMSGDNRRSMPINGGLEEAQEGVSIGRVRTAAKLNTNVYSKEAARAKEDFNKMEGSGFIPNGKTVVKEGVSIKSNIGSVDKNVHLSQDDEGTVVGPVRKTKSASTGGIEVQDTSNIRSEKKPVNGGVKKPEPAKIDVSVSPKIRMARRIDPTFPDDWSFTGKLAERLSKVKEHGATQTFLEALYAAEGDQMRKLLEKEFPKQFGG